MKILTEKTPHYYYRWYAVDDDTYDGPSSPMGFGRTREEAEADLLAEIEDRANSIKADDGQPSEAQEWSDYDRDC